ncbi:MAG: hypothetical protein ACFFAJ_09320 [Candidatus Hodarchaeota archaeon]
MRKRYFSIELCKTCQFPESKCFSVNLDTGDSLLCSYARLREIYKNWKCERCGINFNIIDTRHRVPVAPKEELKKARQAIERGEISYPAKAYAEIEVVCDECIESFEEMHEIFGLD